METNWAGLNSMEREECIIRIRRVLTAAVVVCLAADALVGCSNKKSDKKVIRISAFEPTTGENGGGGYQEVLGTRYAREMHPIINIGDEEYAVKLVEVGNKSDKTEAVNAAQKLVSEKVSVVLGSYDSGASIAAGQVSADAEIPAIDCFCTNPQVTEGNGLYFRVCPIDPFQGVATANYAYQNGAESAVMTTQLGDDYSSSLDSYFKDAFTKLGDSTVSGEQPQINQIDFGAVLINIRAANPDIISAPSSITTVLLIIKQAREFGITVAIAAGDTWENSIIIENVGAGSRGVVLSTFFDEAELANDKAAAFIKGFKEHLVKRKQEGIIPAISTLGYDSYLAVIKAIEDAGSIGTAAIHDVLKNVEIDGVTGNTTSNETDDASKDITLTKTIKDGKLQPLTTTTVE